MKKTLEFLSEPKVKWTIIVILIILFAIVMIGAIAKNRMKNQEEQPAETKEIELTDELRTRIANNINDLSSGNYCEIQGTDPYTNDCIYRKDVITKGELSKEYRLYSLVISIGNRSENNIMVGTIVADGKAFYNPHYVDLEPVEKAYKELYGEEEIQPEIINKISNINLRYDDERKKFFYEEPTDKNFIINHISNYEVKDNELYVYVRIGYMTYEMYKYKLYTGKDKTNLQGDYNTREYKEGNFINETNINVFKEYKFTFERIEGTNNITFKQVMLNK